MFGEVPATGVTVVNEEKITVTVPAQSKVGVVDIVATTLAGESPTSAADKYAYLGCTVPNLAGKKLGPAKSLLRNAGCTVGKVTKVKGPKKKQGKVISQHPKAGRVLAPGAKVAIKLAK